MMMAFAVEKLGIKIFQVKIGESNVASLDLFKKLVRPLLLYLSLHIKGMMCFTTAFNSLWVVVTQCYAYGRQNVLYWMQFKGIWYYDSILSEKKSIYSLSCIFMKHFVMKIFLFDLAHGFGVGVCANFT